MNWTILIIVVIFVLGLVVFLIIRNQKDEKEFEEKMNNDYPKSINQKGDLDDDGL